MRAINPWINFNGNAEGAFTFYKSIFGGVFTKIVRFRDLASDEFLIPEGNKIMTILLPLSKYMS
jgi:PhnB protein